MTIGFCVYENERRADAEIIEKFREVVTPHISDNMNRLVGSSANLTPYHGEGKLVGSALTVKTRPGDNLMIHQAINMAKPGDILVIDGGGDKTQALFGEIMLKLCQKRGISGLIIDGSIRDVKAFQEEKFPVYAKGVTHKGPYKQGPGEVNVTVSIDGMVVHPGDIVVGDEDGLVNIPIDQAETILRKVSDKQQKEDKRLKEIAEGKVTKSFVNKQMLEEMGCEFYK